MASTISGQAGFSGAAILAGLVLAFLIARSITGPLLDMVRAMSRLAQGDLATEIPAAILARTLGIHTDVAVSWQRLSAGDWTSYAAEVSQRPTGA